MSAREKPAMDNRLLSLLERIETLTEERRELTTSMHVVFAQGKSCGYEPKFMRAMIRERAMSAGQREEERALLEIYRAALGMLDDTPLGDAARRRLMKPAAEKPTSDEAAPAANASPPAPDLLNPPPPSAEDFLKARAEGAAAAKAGRKVTENPYPPASKLRAAWDESWCGAAGSDGMDVPAAFRRSKPKNDKASTPPGE